MQVTKSNVRDIVRVQRMATNATKICDAINMVITELQEIRK